MTGYIPTPPPKPEEEAMGPPHCQCLKKKKSPCSQVLRTGWIAQALPTAVQLILLWLPLR